MLACGMLGIILFILTVKDRINNKEKSMSKEEGKWWDQLILM